MFTWVWVVAALVPLASEDAPPLEVRFTDWCHVERAVWAGDRLHFLVRNTYHPEVGMAVYVDNGKLYHVGGPLELRDLAGIGRSATGRLIDVIRQRAPGREKLVFGVRGGRLAGAVDTNPGEGLVSFLPSRPGAFITDWHVGDSVDRVSSVAFAQRLVRFAGAADASGDIVLAGTSGPLERSSKEETGGLWRVESRTGKVEPIRLRARTTSLDKSIPAGVTLLDARVDQIAGILADPHAADWFYVAIGDLHGGGRLLRVAVDGRCEVVFRRETGPFRQIAGTTPDPKLPVGLSKEEGVLAVACDFMHRVHFPTPRGIYRLSPTGAEFVGVPAFESTGGFFVAHNIPGFIVVLSHQGEMAPWASRVFLVPIPSATASQSAPSTR